MLVVSAAKHILVCAIDVVKDIGATVIKALGAEIKIPVLTPLYQFLTDEKLSILSLVALAAAVPVTLIFKAVTGKVPFPDDETSTSLIKVKDFKGVLSIIGKDENLIRNFTIVSEYATMSGLLIEVITTSMKAHQFMLGAPHAVSDTIKQISIPTRLLAIMPKFMRTREDTDPWYLKMDAIVTDLAVLKCLCDATDIGSTVIYGKISPYIDFAVSAAWTVPAVFKMVEAFDGKDSSVSRLSTDLAYCVALMTAPVVWNPAVGPQTQLVVILGANLVVGITAGIRVATAHMLYLEN